MMGDDLTPNELAKLELERLLRGLNVSINRMLLGDLKDAVVMLLNCELKRVEK